MRCFLKPQEFPTAANVSDVVEDEEQETTMTEGGEVISLPGHISPPPSSYHGPQFPVRIPTMQPSPTSDVLAADIRRADILQRQAVDWSVSICWLFIFAYCIYCLTTFTGTYSS